MRPWAALRAVVSTFRHSTRRTPATFRPGLEVLEGRWAPATVTSLANDGPGSLRGAIASTPAGGTVDFQPGLSGTITLTSGTLTIDHDLTIFGPGAAVLAVSGNHAFTVISVSAGVTAGIDGLSIANGGNGASGGTGAGGSGIFNAGTLTLTNSTLTGNASTGGHFGGAAEPGGVGGGIDNFGTMNVAGCTIVGNRAFSILGTSAGGAGGGIANLGTMRITTSTIADNTAEDGVGGGGIRTQGTLTISNSTIASNMATGKSGGGISNNVGGTLTVLACTIVGNSAGGGGGIQDLGPDNVTIINSTITGNSAGVGGGLEVQGEVTILNCTIAGNSATGFDFGGHHFAGMGGGIDNGDNFGLVTLINVLVASNSAPTAPDIMGKVTAGTSFNNLIGDGSGSTGLSDGVNGNQVGSSAQPIDPLLGALTDNGGPTRTQSLLPGSPAIDAGTDSVGLTSDQRGFPRPARTHTDIGAFEYQATPADERFVQALYRDVLGRVGAPAELGGWLVLLTVPGGSRTAVAAGIEGSFEACDRLVKGWYQTFLGRPAQGGEETGWVSLLQAGVTEEQVLAEILGDPVGHEFFDRSQGLVSNGTPNERFVQALYQVLLGRAGSGSEVAGWTAVLDSQGAAGRPGVVLGFLDSTEYRGDVVAGYYSTLLRRTASPEEVNGWVFSGLDLRAVRIAIEASPEYYAAS
jgi:hypothetical protein